MADVTSTIREASGATFGCKVLTIESGTTVTGGTDTVEVTLANYGITSVLAVYTVVHTTDYSVMVSEAATTAVASGVLTVTTASGNNNKRRVVTVFGK
jgi:hypothetical protein